MVVCLKTAEQDTFLLIRWRFTYARHDWKHRYMMFKYWHKFNSSSFLFIRYIEFSPFTGSFAMWWNTEAARSTPVFVITDRVPKIIHGQAIKTQDLSVKLRPFSLSRPTRQMFRIVSHPGLLLRTLEYPLIGRLVWLLFCHLEQKFLIQVLLYAPLWQNAESYSNCTSLAAHNYGLVNCRRLS